MGADDRKADVVLDAKTTGYSRGMAAAASDTTKVTTAVDLLATRLDNLQKKAGQKLALFGLGAGAGIAGLTKSAADLEQQLGTLQASAVVGGKSFEGMERSVRNLTHQFPIARGQAIEMITTLDNLGVKGEKNLTNLSVAFTKLGAATGESMSGLASSMVTLGRQMDTLQAGSMDQFANSLLVVSRQSGVSASGVLQFASAIAPAARAAGIGEQSLLGISAAFQKAGADGYGAANTFNQVINDITRQIVTGSPDIAKYANLIGVTSDQLKNMDKGEVVTQLFEAINKQGPDAIKTLDRLGFDGVRTMRSIQAVSQGGGLRKAIEDATGAYGNTTALDKGSAAALDGLNDTLAQTKNEFQDLATTAGGPFLAAMTPVAEVFERMLSAVSALAQPLAGVGALMGSVLGGGALALGGSMMMARISSMVAVARTAGGSASVFRQGIAGGRYVAGGAEPVGRNLAAAERYTSGQMRWWQSPMYSAGAATGQFLGPGAGMRSDAVGAGRLSRLMGRGMNLGTSFMDAQAEFYRNSNLPYEQRTSPMLNAMGARAGIVRGAYSAIRDDPRAFVAGLRTPQAGLSGLDLQRYNASKQVLASGGTLPEATVSRLRESMVATTTATAATAQANRGAAAAAGALTTSFLRLRMESMGATLGGVTGAVGSVAGRTARGIGGAAIGLVGGNPYAAAAIGAGALGYEAYNLTKQSNAIEVPETAEIDKYNAALGISTSELGTFADAIKHATAQLPKGATVESAARVSPDVISLSRQPDRKLTSDIFKDLKSDKSRAAFLESMGITDSRQLGLAQADIAQTSSVSAAQRATNIYMRNRRQGGEVDYQAIIAAADAEQGKGIKGHLGVADPTAKRIIGATFGSIESQYGYDAERYNGKYAAQRQFNQTSQLLGAALGSGLNFREQSPVDSLMHAQAGPRTTGGRTATSTVRAFENEFLDRERVGFNATKFAKQTDKMTDQEASAYFVDKYLVHGENKNVRERMKDFQKEGINLAGVGTEGLMQLQNQSESSYTRKVRRTGLGAAALDSTGAIQAAAMNEGDLNKQYQGIQSMLASATALGGGLNGTNAELQKFKDAIDDPTDKLYQLADAAQQFNTNARQIQMADSSRVGSAALSIGNYRQAIDANPSGRDYQKNVDASMQEVQTQKDSIEEYMKSLIAAQKSYSIQVTRGEEDMARSIRLGNEDFWRGMHESEDDYYKSRSRSQRNFQISMERSTEDFNRSMTRQAEDAAKSIMSPFQRLQSQYTSSVGSLSQNMADQTEQFRRQRSQTRQVRGMGLSRQAVDQLDLTNPQMAQQLNRLVQDLQADPQMIQKLNRQARQRQGAVTNLTQNKDNQSYRRTIADFERGQARAHSDNARMLDDMATDFQTMTDRAVSSHKRGLTRMQEEYGIQMKRSREDLARMGEQIYGEFGTLMGEAVRRIKHNLGPLGDAIIGELDKIRTQFPEFFSTQKDLAGGNVGKPGHPSPDAIDRPTYQNLGTKGTATGTRAGSGTTVYDSSTTYTGSITVKAEDTATMERELAEKRRRRRLTVPHAAAAAG